MSIIIRLENLPWSANSADIRHFFDGLDIPDGGVHIIGGEKGDAFIAFMHDEDARRAMMRNNLSIKDNRISLFLSSHMELNQSIEMVHKETIPQEPLLTPMEFGLHDHYRSPVCISERKSLERSIRRSPDRNIRRSPDRNIRRAPDRNIRRSPDRNIRRSPDRNIRRSLDRNIRRSPDRNSRRSPNRNNRRSPDRNVRGSPNRNARRRSLDRTSRRKSPDRNSRRTSSDRNVRRRSPERGRRRSPDRLNRRRSPNTHSQHRSRDRFRKSRQSRSPITSRHRSRSPLRQFPNTHGYPQAERQASPVRRNDGDFSSVHLGIAGDNRDPYLAPRETFQVQENTGIPPQNETFQRNPIFMERAQLYDRCSPKAPGIPPSTSWKEPDYPSRVEHFDNSNYSTNMLQRGLEERPFVHCPPEVHAVREEFLNVRKEFNMHPPLQRDFMPINNIHGTPSFNDFNHPGFEKRDFPHGPIPRDVPRPADDFKEESVFSKNFPMKPSFFNPQEVNRLPRNEPRFPPQGPMSEHQNFPHGFQDTYSDFRPKSGEFELESVRDINTNWNRNKSDTMTRPFNRLPNYCVQMSGFGPNRNFKDVQSVLKGIYAPQKNIKWDASNRGGKTEVVYVKISNEEDFNTILKTAVYFLNENRIEVTKCPDEIYGKMFPRDKMGTRYGTSYSRDLVYMLKGLPYSTSQADIVDFFKGLKLINVIILYDKDSKATGTGFVEFENLNDYQRAFERNGKKIGHRYIELLKSTQEEVNDAKRTAVSTSKPFDSAMVMAHVQQKNFPENSMLRPQVPEKRPFCAFLFGLPTNIKTEQIYDFFSECGIEPQAVHVLLNDMREPDNIAYIEFFNQFELETALKRHKCFIGRNSISVNQIPYEKMVNILDTNRAIHVFKNPNPVKPPIPEKVPYLWNPDEFRDVGHNARKDSNYNNPSAPWCENPKNFNHAETQRHEKGNVQVFDYSHHENNDFPHDVNKAQNFGNATSSFDEDMSPHPACFSPTFSSPRTPPDFGIDDFVRPSPSRISMEANRQFGTQSSQRPNDMFLHSQSEYRNNFQFSKPTSNQESKFSVPYVSEVEDRVPVKFEMKTQRSVVTSSQVNDAFGKTTEGEKMELHKLSPVAADKTTFKQENISNDKLNVHRESSRAYKRRGDTSDTNKTVRNDHKIDESNKPRFYGKDAKSTNQKKTFNEKNTPHTVQNNAASKQSGIAGKKSNFGKEKESYKGGTRSKPMRTNFKVQPRKEFEGDIFLNQRNDSEMFVEHQSDAYDPFQSADVNKFEVVDSQCNSFGESGCTIQASDVHPSVGLNELMEFFRGFNLRAEDIIRRFTDFGVPTGDIRVAFRNSQDAIRALRTLNYKSLKGVPVKMFIV